jgi:hypothetical protein
MREDKPREEAPKQLAPAVSCPVEKEDGEVFKFNSPIIETANEFIKPYFSSYVKELHPSIDFKDGVAYVGTALRADVRSKNSENEPEVRKKFFLVTSRREIIPIENLNDYGLTLSNSPVGFETRWSPESIAEFLNGAEVSPKKVFEGIRNAYLEYIEFEDSRVYDFITLWTIGTYFHRLFSSYPYVYLGGVKRTGKSKTLTIASELCFNGILSMSLTTSSLFRLVDGARCVLLLDESEGLANPERAMELRALLLSGYKKGGVVYRTEKTRSEKFFPQGFEVYSPKMLANIQGVEDILEDRCVTIIMRRGKDKNVVNSEIKSEDPIWQELRDELHVFYLQEVAKFSQFINSVVSEDSAVSEGSEQHVEVTARALELWKPILILAKYFEKFGLKPNNRSYDSLFAEILDIAKEKESQRRMENITETRELILVRALYELVQTNDFYSVRTIQERVNSLLDGDEEPLSTRWIGRALKRLGFLEKRRLSPGVEYRLTVEQVRDLAERMEVLNPSTCSSPSTPTTQTTLTSPDSKLICKPEMETSHVPLIGTSIVENDTTSIYKQDSKQTNLSGEFVNNLGREGDTSITPGEAPPSLSKVDAVYKNVSSSPSTVPNESKVTVSGTISPEAILRIRSLEDCTPFNPLYMSSTCYACNKEGEGLWKQVSRGFSIYQLCDDCFKEWSKHFLKPDDSYGKEG